MEELYNKLNSIPDTYLGFVAEQPDFHEFGLGQQELAM